MLGLVRGEHLLLRVFLQARCSEKHRQLSEESPRAMRVQLKRENWHYPLLQHGTDQQVPHLALELRALDAVAQEFHFSYPREVLRVHQGQWMFPLPVQPVPGLPRAATQGPAAYPMEDFQTLLGRCQEDTRGHEHLG